MQTDASLGVRLRRSRAALMLLAAVPAAIAAIVVAMAHDPSPAAPSRLIQTGVVLAAAFAALLGLPLAWRACRDAALAVRWRGAPAGMRDTMQFLLHERRLSRRGRLSIMALGILAFASTLFGHWPQLQLLGRMRPLFLGLGIACCALLLLQLLRARRSLINQIYLGRYLRQQAAHIGWKRRPEPAPAVGAPAVQRISATEFRAGHFDWSFEDWTKNGLLLGQPGSGKTSCVLNALLEGLIGTGEADTKAAGLILDPKGTYRTLIAPLCSRLGRTNDLYILSEANWHAHRRSALAVGWNPLDTREDALEVASRFHTTLKLAGGMQSRESFFEDAARSFVRHAFELSRAALDPNPASVLDVLRLCSEPIAEASLYQRHIDRLLARYPALPPRALAEAVDYFELEWRVMPDRQLAGVRSTVKQILDDFTVEPIAEIVSGPSTITTADLLDRGGILYVDLPLAGRERVARILISLLRLDFQREVLRRPGKARPSFLLADEFQSLFIAGENHGDSDFFERSRESNHANIVAAQNLASFLKRTPNRHDVTNFLGLCGVKMFLRNSERECNEAASSLFGERSEIIVSASEAAQLEGSLSRHRTNYSRSTQTRRIVPVDAFTKLAVPVRGHARASFAQSIVHLGSRAAFETLELCWPLHPLVS